MLPEDLAVQGEVLASHVRSVDTQARPIRYTGTSVPEAVLTEARAKLTALIGL